jgi:hypothetical protein
MVCSIIEVSLRQQTALQRRRLHQSRMKMAPAQLPPPLPKPNPTFSENAPTPTVPPLVLKKLNRVLGVISNSVRRSINFQFTRKFKPHPSDVISSDYGGERNN